MWPVCCTKSRLGHPLRRDNRFAVRGNSAPIAVECALQGPGLSVAGKGMISRLIIEWNEADWIDVTARISAFVFAVTSSCIPSLCYRQRRFKFRPDLLVGCVSHFEVRNEFAQCLKINFIADRKYTGSPLQRTITSGNIRYLFRQS
jgi:hypothetical protein